MSLSDQIKTPQPAIARLDVPTKGHVLSTVSEQYGGPVRTAVRILTAAIEESGCFVPDLHTEGIWAEESAVLKRADAGTSAWHICAQWAVATALGENANPDGLLDALYWFDSNNSLVPLLSQLDPGAIIQASQELATVAIPVALSQLLPYILDPHGLGTRLSVMKDPTTYTARSAKRAHGVFYTPADVAEHIARIALEEADYEPRDLRILDPACGTGVFLRAAFKEICSTSCDPISIATECLFGCDIDPWAVNGCAYVLMHDALAQTEKRIQPVNLWALIRHNLATVDALSLDPDVENHPLTLFSLETKAERFELHDVFPRLVGGANVIIGNPPYAEIGPRPDLTTMSALFQTFPSKGSAAVDMHPLFLEQMVRLSAPSSSCGMVIPLSIAFNTSQQFQATRRLIDETAGTWRFSFFDREPHALFGEEVKTRNSIVHWCRTSKSCASRKKTGPLMKWRGHDRARMLHSLPFTEIHGPVAEGIPKLRGAVQARALEILQYQPSSLAGFVRSYYSTQLEKTFDGDRKTVFVGSTAYNFLNVFFRPPAGLLPSSALLTTNTIHDLRCASTRDAFAVFALLSSGVTFWLWHVLADGFHVSRAFLEALPLGPTLFNADTIAALSDAGKTLWKDVQAHPVSSLNRGRASLSFPASRLRDQQKAIDSIIADAAGLPAGFLSELDHFIASVVDARPHTHSSDHALPEVIHNEES